MKESTHGGDLVSARVLWAGEVLDFSANLNPLGMPEGVRRAAESFRQAGVKQVGCKLYPGLRHEILCEDCREQVYQDLLDWMESAVLRPVSAKSP